MLCAIVRHEVGYTDHINRALPFQDTEKKRRTKICDWHILFGTYILVFDFLVKNYFQSNESLYPFKRLTRLLSSHLVHLDDLIPASCIC